MFITKQSWFIFLAAWVFLVAIWTVLIKFLFPVMYALNYGEEILSYIMWDFWWIAHLWLAYSFLNISRYTFYIGSLISVGQAIAIPLVIVSRNQGFRTDDCNPASTIRTNLTRRWASTSYRFSAPTVEVN